MTTLEARKLVAMLVAAYPAWKPPEETQRLYAGFIEQLDYDVARAVVKEIIELPRDFAPTVGRIIAKAKEKLEIAERDRRLAMPRKYPPGEIRYDPKGRKFVADRNGDLQLREAPDEMLSVRRKAS